MNIKLPQKTKIRGKVVKGANNRHARFSREGQVTTLSEHSKSKTTKELERLNKKVMSYLNR
ncbi:hypothetical protein CEH05_19840 [Halobacillus halophilus]|uniref:Uncharacterized protein n=1 Tax=Halobacillus halophilus (strain ATCC 35676 / DSM 2266 / JCM 20832 / KCTC 3685 / LMG 17431 / NBRC 102448 / NCIMB 2269) TaxID=866895 RepID=I0JTA6_HALH3|nr:hypothetical protein [Halobacillus halophilus]ASF41293.1 hypothetical protein CEH05_19840 [Halobacillus halophilus]CCG47378.1 hypothetical protein HBHAL_5043 [Halobacillus halophilus DSM 2266]